MEHTEKRGERVAKIMARSGVCSRRDAEKMIAQGRVSIDGVRINTPATFVSPENQVEVDGNPIAKIEPTRLWRLHKPTGLVTTHKDPQERPTVFDALPKVMPRVVSIGRLDLNTEGLLLLTNDGGLARQLELPATGWIRKYRCRVYGPEKEYDFSKLKKGIQIDGIRYGPIDVQTDRKTGVNQWLTVSLKEGKKREVRHALEYLGFRVSRLIRISYGPFQLGNLDRGQVDEIARRVLRDQLGAFLSGNDRSGKD